MAGLSLVPHTFMVIISVGNERTMAERYFLMSCVSILQSGSNLLTWFYVEIIDAYGCLRWGYVDV